MRKIRLLLFIMLVRITFLGYSYASENLLPNLFSVELGQEDFELKNDYIHLKQDLTRGGAISYISKSGATRNVVNVYDEGRYIQQSYYAGALVDRQSEGQSPSWSPWRWNVIQGGDYAGNKSPIILFEKTDSSLYVKCTPMQWDMNNKPAEAIMEQWTYLEGNVIHVKNKFTSFRTDSIYGEDVPLHQEIPAVYPISALKNLYSYFGDEPYTNAPMDNPSVVYLSSGFWGRYESVTEKWMAFVDNKLWGLGVYSSTATLFLAGMSGQSGGETKNPSTSYIAPVRTERLKKESVMEYEYFLILGTLDEIRSAVYQRDPAYTGLLKNEYTVPSKKLYPNPVETEIFLNIEKPTSIRIYDVNARLLQEMKIYSEQDKIDVSGLSGGYYFLLYNDGTESATLPFIKLF